MMLLVQASNGRPILGLADQSRVIFDSAAHDAFNESRDYRAMLEFGLSQTGKTLDDLNMIAVDIGPGGLGVTRTSVSFCNALGFSRGIRVIGIPAVDLLGFEAGKATSKTATSKTAVVLRRAARPNVHFGIVEIDNGAPKTTHFAYYTEEKALKHLENLDDFSIVGNVQLSDTLVPAGNTAQLDTMRELALILRAQARDAVFPIVEDLS